MPAFMVDSMRHRDRKQGTSTVLLIAVCHHIHDIFTSFLAPLLPVLIGKLGLSLTQAGALSVFQQAPALANFLIGSLADRRGARWLLIAAPALTALCMSLAGAAPTYTTLAVLLLCAGISNSTWHVPAPVVIAHSMGHRVGRGMSLYMFGGETARAVGPLVAVAAVSWWGLEGLWRSAPLGLLASMLLWLRLPRTQPAPRHVSRARAALPWRTWLRILGPIVALVICRSFLVAALTTFLPTLLNQEGASLWIASAALTILQAAGAVGVLASGTVSDRVGRRRVLFLVVATSPLLMLGFLDAAGMLALLWLVPLGLLALSTTPVLLAMVQEQLPEHPAAANGVFMTANFLVRAAVVLVVGVIADHVGLRTTFYACALLSLLAVPVTLMLPRRPNPATRPDADL